jgi:hypothetical protein
MKPFLEELSKFQPKKKDDISEEKKSEEKKEDDKRSYQGDDVTEFSDFIQEYYGREIVLTLIMSKHNLTFVGDLKLKINCKNAICTMLHDKHRTNESNNTTKFWRLLDIHTDYHEFDKKNPARVEPHQTILLINRDSLTIEEFDPIGNAQENQYSMSYLDNWCRENYPDYYFVPCSSYYTTTGLHKDGNCWLLTVLWLLIKVTSPDLHNQAIIQHLLDLEEKDTFDGLLMKMGHWIVDYLENIDFLNHRNIYQEYDNSYGKAKAQYLRERNFGKLREIAANHKKVFDVYLVGDFKKMLQLITSSTF